jgi:plasmid stabilization system protein ParE
MKKIRIHNAARREINEAIVWYAELSSILGHRLRAEIRAAFSSARSHPLRYPRYLHKTRKVLLKSFPYLVVFLDRQDDVFIIAVAHAKRDPGYWATRVPVENQ